MRRCSVRIFAIASLFLGLLLIPYDSLATSNSPTIGPVINAKLTYPQIVTAELGVAYLSSKSTNDLGFGPFISYEPGINGHKLHLGYCIGSFMDSVPTDIEWITGRLSLSYFRPWRQSSGLVKNDNYYGIEFVGSYKIFLLSVGGYYSPENDKLIASFGVGIGW